MFFRKAVKDSKETVLSTGTPATATIVRMREGGHINHQPVITLELEVQLPDAAPYQATTEGLLPHLVLSRLEPGATVPVRVASHDTTRVFIDENAMMGVPETETGRRLKAKPDAITLAYVIEHGTPARVRVRKVRNYGVKTPDGRDPALIFKLEVQLPGEEPYRAKVILRTPQQAIAQVVAGSELPGRVLPGDRRHVVIDWVAAGLASDDWLHRASAPTAG